MATTGKPKKNRISLAEMERRYGQLLTMHLNLFMQVAALHRSLWSKGTISPEDVQQQLEQLMKQANKILSSTQGKDQIEELRKLLEDYDGPLQ